MTVGIISDSSSDIRLSYAETNNVKIVPSKVNYNGEDHYEDKNFDLDAYYKLFEEQEDFLPKSFPGETENYYKALKELIEEDSKEIIIINLSKVLSLNY